MTRLGFFFNTNKFHSLLLFRWGDNNCEWENVCNNYTIILSDHFCFDNSCQHSDMLGSWWDYYYCPPNLKWGHFINIDQILDKSNLHDMKSRSRQNSSIDWFSYKLSQHWKEGRIPLPLMGRVKVELRMAMHHQSCEEPTEWSAGTVILPNLTRSLFELYWLEYVCVP